MSEELGECPNNTENTVCLMPFCKYKHDRVWPIPPAIQEAMEREVDHEVFLGSRQNVPELFESYVDRMLKTQTKCPCGCGGIFEATYEANKEADDAQGNDEE